jgi:hypothetical protein
MVTASNCHAPLQTEVDTLTPCMKFLASLYSLQPIQTVGFCVAQLFCNWVRYIFLELQLVFINVHPSICMSKHSYIDWSY